jgi:predicted transcriptional regulator
MAGKKTIDPVQDFGPHLKALILKAGYPSVEKFALENGFDRVTIYRIVEKGADPRLSTLIKLLRALEVTPQTLINT